MQALIHHHLRRRASLQPPLAASGHLDEDSLAAFTEGRLTKSESTPIITHLVDCAFCRRTTVRIIHFSAELGETEQVELSQTNAEPGRLKRLL
jgi:anti-sigma factor ChrR (cupin superfamily)